MIPALITATAICFVALGFMIWRSFNSISIIITSEQHIEISEPTAPREVKEPKEWKRTIRMMEGFDYKRRNKKLRIQKESRRINRKQGRKEKIKKIVKKY